MHPLEAASLDLRSPPFKELSLPQKKVIRQLKTILLAEDDDDLRWVMECTFTTMGYQVIACADAQLASAVFRSQPAIDILLTDFQMPGQSGMELARELTAVCPSLPVIIITGSTLSPRCCRRCRTKSGFMSANPTVCRT